MRWGGRKRSAVCVEGLRGLHHVVRNMRAERMCEMCDGWRDVWRSLTCSDIPARLPPGSLRPADLSQTQ